MENKLSNIKERVLQIAENKGIVKERFFEKIGMTYGNFKGKSKFTPLNSNAIEDILTMYEDVNPMWLITGKGEMIIGESSPKSVDIQSVRKLKTDHNKEHQTIPLYDVRATAGVIELLGDQAKNKHIPIDYISIPNMPKCDGALPITGDSMYPLLKSGDIVLYKELHNVDNIIWGEMYLVAIVYKGDEFFFTKYVQRSEKEGWVILISQNSNHQPKEFPLKSIKAIALIKASIRINSTF